MRSLLRMLLLVSLLCGASHFTRADDVLILVTDVPAHGVVASHVDLTAAVKWSKMGAIQPHALQAVSSDNGQSVPFQFVPDLDFDSRERITGTVLLRLPEGTRDQVCLKLRSSQSPAVPEWDGTVATDAFTVRHDPKRMGGLPSRVEFPKTGKVFDKFAWNDRVHHGESGGFHLRHDAAAKVELLSAGPVGTAVRVRAAYQQPGGKRPPSSPEAVYQWCYFRDLPLVFVTAEISQREPAEWREVHFLEWNFPGEDFLHWAGGEPTSQGELTGSQNSFSLSQWGALVDGPNAIALLRSGRALFHDGRGRYGTYLHADGNRAWQAWNTTERRCSAWYWIGSSEKPIEAIRTQLNQLPSDASVRVTSGDVRTQIKAARTEATKMADRLQQQRVRGQVALADKLEAQERFAESLDVLRGRLPENWTDLAAGELRMVLERADDGIRLLSLLDTTTHHECLTARPLPLFTLTMRHCTSKKEVRLNADSGWGDIEVLDQQPDKAFEIHWQKPSQNEAAVQLAQGARSDWPSNLHVVVRAVADAGRNAICWSLDVKNGSSEWGVWRVVFPQIAVAQPGKEPRVFLPRGPGEIQQGLWQRAFRHQGLYPNGWTAMQFVAAYDELRTTGLYVATHDPAGSTKDILIESRPKERAVVFSFDHPAPNMGKAANGFTLSGEAVWRLLRGDWYDAAVIYRDWVRKEARWYPELTAEGRKDTPLWMRELPVWALGGGAPSQCVPAVKAFAKSLDLPVGFHWYSWHQIPFDNDYPHYFPTKEGFADGVRELQGAGVKVMPYINGRLWDTRDKNAEDFEFSRVALPAATKDEDGQYYSEMYSSKESDGSRVKLGVMCPTTPLWQDRVAGIVGRLFGEYRLDGVYIDQVAAASPKLCFDPTYQHPLGGGHWWTEGYWKLLDEIRDKKPKDRMLTTECNAEPYIRWFDGYLTWHWQYDGQVPAFPAVYGGAIQMFGRAYRGGETKDLALRMKAGQQLVFGEQIGWIGPNVINEKQNIEFLSQVVRLRWQLRRYFYAGEMARPPRLVGSIPTVQADWQWSGKWPVTTDAVLTGAWRLPREDRLVLFFVNVGDEPISAKLRFDGKAYGFSHDHLNVAKRTADDAGEKTRVPRIFEQEIAFPARTPFVWEVTPMAE